MEYKIFYSYQSDIDHGINKEFIKKALHEAVTLIKSFRFKVIEGFDGTSGNKPLADTMFEQSESCDIFVGDLSFTSSRNEFQKWKFDLFGFGYYVRTPEQAKMSPNPNVLIEMGYSWAKKQYDRTILILNEAFGSPASLPVDMGHIRFPVTYSLDEKQAKDPEELKQVYNKLVGDLVVAVKAAAVTTETHHRKRFWPFKIHRDWKDPAFGSRYLLSDRLERTIIQLRGALEKPGSVQRLVGAPKSGRSRMAHELYKHNGNSLPRHDDQEKVLFYDIKITGYASIESVILNLVSLRQDKVLIIDNCGPEIHERIKAETFRSDLRVLTIGSYPGTVEHEDDLVIDWEMVREIGERMISQKYAGQAAQALYLEVDGDLGKAAAYLKSNISDADVVELTYDKRWELLLEGELYGKGALKLLEAMSLFSKVGISGKYSDQIEWIVSTFLEGASVADTMETLNQLVDKELVATIGDFGRVENFRDELSANWMGNHSAQELTQLLQKLQQVKLAKAFAERLVEFDDDIILGKLRESIVGANGVFADFGFVDSENGSRLILGLSEILPEETMLVLTTALKGKTREELLHLVAGRRNLVWALERLAFRKETFSDAAGLLLALSAAENENISNNATGTFVGLFQAVLSGTEVDLVSRFGFLENALGTSQEPEETEVIFSALNRGLMAGGYIRMMGTEKQAGKELKVHSPSMDETMEYWKLIIGLLVSKLDG